MNKWPHQLADSDLAPWEADLARRLSSLQQLPTPPSLTNEAAEGFIARLRTQPVKLVAPIQRRPVPMLRLGMRFAAILLACVLGLSGVGYATATSLPGDPLYGLKRQVEIAQLAASPLDQRAAFAETLVDRRLQEMTQLIRQDAPETQVDAGVAEYAAAAVAFGQTSSVSDRTVLFRRHLAELDTLEAVAPNQTRAALQMAQRAAQAQLASENRTAPAPSVETPGVHPSQTPTSSPTARPSATTAPAQPTISYPSIKEPTAQAPQYAVVSPTPTTEVLPSATPPAATPTPKAARRPSPAITPTAAAKPAPVHRASPQPTHDSPPPPRPSTASRQTQQPEGDHQQAPPTPQTPGDGHQQAPPTPQIPDDGHQQMPPTPQIPDDGHQQMPPTPEQSAEPRDPAAPPAQGTPAPRPEQPSDVPEATREPSTRHDPPHAPTADKPQATRTKPDAGGSQQSPPASGGSHPQPPGQGGKP